MLQQGPSILLKVALGVGLSTSLTFIWYSSGISNTIFTTGKPVNMHTPGSESLTRGSVKCGLRMVVFGGGDIATPTRSTNNSSNAEYAWTDIMCQKLACDTYISFIPETDDIGGAVLSNPLLDAAYNHAVASGIDSNRGDNIPKIDYSWATRQYPKPHLQDLAAQVDAFLASSRQQQATESLWVFNVGYWDIWYLAALPRNLATAVLDSSARDLFFQIERLYQATKDRGPVAGSGSSFDTGTPPIPNALIEEARPGADRITRPPPPFRIFLTRLLDISLTPGFTSARPKPPSPHSSSSQLRNAAFLTEYWNALLETVVDDWLATPDPKYWSTADTVDIRVVEALVGKRSPVEAGGFEQGEKGEHQDHHYHRGGEGRHSRDKEISPLPRRQFASYGMSRYIQELMIDHQLREADLSDHNGLGARPAEDGFLDISMPCVLEVMDNGDNDNATNRTIVCREPDNYLFYTEFTVGQRTIREIGMRAARRFLDQVETGSRWLERARMQYKTSEREHEGYETGNSTV